MISKADLKEISLIVGPEHLITARDELAEYAFDATKLEFMPDAVVFPNDSDQVSRILCLANDKGFPVIVEHRKKPAVGPYLFWIYWRWSGTEMLRGETEQGQATSNRGAKPQVVVARQRLRQTSGV